MQLVNEPGTLAGHQGTAIKAGENPKTYAQELALAFGEPTVTFNKFKAGAREPDHQHRQGRDAGPRDLRWTLLLKIGKWFSNNKWALDALGVAAGQPRRRRRRRQDRLGGREVRDRRRSTSAKFLLTGTTGHEQCDGAHRGSHKVRPCRRGLIDGSRHADGQGRSSRCRRHDGSRGRRQRRELRDHHGPGWQGPSLASPSPTSSPSI